MSYLNPNHPVSQKMFDQWHKVVGLVMLKLDIAEVVITLEDLQQLQQGLCVVAHDQADGLHIRLVSESEGRQLVSVHGGQPN